MNSTIPNLDWTQLGKQPVFFSAPSFEVKESGELWYSQVFPDLDCFPVVQPVLSAEDSLASEHSQFLRHQVFLLLRKMLGQKLMHSWLMLPQPQINLSTTAVLSVGRSG
jgi:hypothetical protein